MPWLAGLLDGQVQQRDQRFAAFQREGFGPEKFFLKKFFKDHRVCEPARIRTCSSRESWIWFSVLSMLRWSHWRVTVSSRCMNCAPIEPQ